MNTGKLIGCLVFIVVWVVGCAIADYVLRITDTAWLMLWGALTWYVADKTSEKTNEYWR